MNKQDAMVIQDAQGTGSVDFIMDGPSSNLVDCDPDLNLLDTSALDSDDASTSKRRTRFGMGSSSPTSVYDCV